MGYKKVGKYELGRTIGEGTFGKVKFAVNTETSERVAIKILDKQKILRQGMAEAVKKEITIMKMINHKHIVNLRDVLASKTKIYIVCELATGGELFYKLAHEGKFDENKARYYFQQLISGMEYCHAKGVCHRDLKPENLLLNEDQLLKISDFGLSAIHRSDGMQGGTKLLYTTCGTPNYVAPEVLGDKGYEGTPADVWSCGVILFVFLAGYLPFDESSTDLLFKKIQKGVYKMPPWLSPGSKALISRLLVVDPTKRMTIEEIKNDAWFKVNNETPSLPLSLPSSEPTTGPPSFQNVEEEEGEGDGEGDGEKDEHDETHLPKVVINGLTVTNAFDLIALSGVLDMTRMLAPHPPSEQMTRYTKWSSTTDADRILSRLDNTLTQLGISHTVNAKRYKIRATHTSPHKGQLTFIIQVFLMAPGLHLVDFRKGLGDILEFHRIYKQIYEECKDIVTNERK